MQHDIKFKIFNINFALKKNITLLKEAVMKNRKLGVLCREQ